MDAICAIRLGSLVEGLQYVVMFDGMVNSCNLNIKCLFACFYICFIYVANEYGCEVGVSYGICKRL